MNITSYDSTPLSLLWIIAVALYPITVVIVAAGVSHADKARPFSGAGMIIANYFGIGIMLGMIVMVATLVLSAIFWISCKILMLASFLPSSFEMPTEAAIIVILILHGLAQIVAYGLALTNEEPLK